MNNPDKYQKRKTCRKCGRSWNNPLSELCTVHLDELRRERREAEEKIIEELKARGPVCSEEECEHVNIYRDHCFDCGADDEVVVCGMCREWTGTLMPCC